MVKEKKAKEVHDHKSTGKGRAIEVHDLKKTYIDGFFGQKQIHALRGITFDVGQGEIFGLVGPNGAGKTTFVKVLLGIIRPTDGQATVMGHPSGSMAARRLIGYLPENLRMPNHLNGYTALEYYGNLSNVPTSVIRQKRDELLTLVGIEERARSGVGTYSKGMRQRLGLAQCLLHEPKMLVLDEPTDGLDPVVRQQVRSLLVRLKQEHGTTIFINSHILQELELICDRVAILDKGTLRYVGTVNDLQTQRIAKPAPAAQTDAQKRQAALAGADGGQQTGLKVDLELEGDQQAIQSILRVYGVERLEPIGPGEWKASVTMPNQPAVDAMVDKLRGANINIIGLSRHRVSLEDAFIEMLAEPSE